MTPLEIGTIIGCIVLCIVLILVLGRHKSDIKSSESMNTMKGPIINPLSMNKSTSNMNRMNRSPVLKAAIFAGDIEPMWSGENNYIPNYGYDRFYAPVWNSEYKTFAIKGPFPVGVIPPSNQYQL